MKKTQKKQITATLLLLYAVIQIINFARWNIHIKPILNFDFAHRGFFPIVFSTLNWPFKITNYYLYYLLGWVALLTPIFFITLALTFFSKRETRKVKRQRILYIWGLAELTIFIYIINYLSFIVVSKDIKPGYLVSHIFAVYLRKIGGIFFLTLFFFWSFIAFFIYLRKSSWKIFISDVSKFCVSAIIAISNILAKVVQKENKKNQKKITETKKVPKPIKLLKDNRNPNEQNKEKLNQNYDYLAENNIENSENNYNMTAQSPDKKNNIIEAKYESLALKEFDTTRLNINFAFNYLNTNINRSFNQEYIESNTEKIEKVFTDLGISLKKAKLTTGPRLHRIEYEFPRGIQLREIEKQKSEISCRLGGMNVDIELPIPRTDRFGIYIARENPDVLGLATYLIKLKEIEQEIPLFLGVAADGSDVWCNAAALPHLLISGTTGSGKTVFLNNVILNLLAVSVFKPLNLVLIDPKRVEFAPYQNAYQLSVPVISDLDNSRSILLEAIELMERRYTKITESLVRNIMEYNKQAADKMPYMFIIIDEFADLIMQDNSGEVKNSIIRLAQKSRAVGVHIILATQRPSADIIDGLIKANFPARIAFKTSSKIDSRIILDENGAENLLGKGDMLVRILPEIKCRLQGVFVSIDEIKETMLSMRKTH